MYCEFPSIPLLDNAFIPNACNQQNEIFLTPLDSLPITLNLFSPPIDPFPTRNVTLSKPFMILDNHRKKSEEVSRTETSHILFLLRCCLNPRSYSSIWCQFWFKPASAVHFYFIINSLKITCFFLSSVNNQSSIPWTCPIKFHPCLNWISF